ncbi:hypothetical protein L208DRAFT_1338271 [Tricholoma matsutake]|nr:hypothetical protein L208DRAFT_1338271 [Tricholoma matsutake 945]
MATLTNEGTATQEIRLRKAHVKTSKTAHPHPIITQEDKECLATFVSIGGFKAWTLWDSGSTTTGIMPTFAQVAEITVFPLSNPHTLQLGMVGSHSTINFGTETLVTAPGVNSTIYMDIANFDCYDMIIGTPFMRANQVHLDFKHNQVIVNRVAIPAMKVELADTDRHLHRYRKQKDTWEPPPPDQYSHLCDHWRDDYADIMDGVREVLPPWQEVNHEIHLIDESKRYHYHLPQCPNSLRDEFYTKVNRYANSGWWEPKSVSQAAPMLCVRKKDNCL